MLRHCLFLQFIVSPSAKHGVFSVSATYTDYRPIRTTALVEAFIASVQTAMEMLSAADAACRAYVIQRPQL